jgi:hypothetical protein
MIMQQKEHYQEEDWLVLLLAYVFFGLPLYGLYKLGVWLAWWPALRHVFFQ